MSTAPLHDLEPSLPDSTDSFMECRNLEPLELLRWSVETYPNRVALATGFGAEGIVLIDLLSRVTDKPRVFTLDTGRLHPETYQLMAEVEDRFNLKIEVHFPDHRKVEEMVRTQGINLFYDSVENRKRCCQVRKVEPLQRALKDLDAWITGLRRQQSDYRSNVSKIEVEAEGRLKINPLANWSEQEVWEHIRKNQLPYNKLHDLNYPSIGCAPCTRPVEPGEDSRAGRWWWEDSHKGCGLHEPKEESSGPAGDWQGELVVIDD